MMGRGDDTGDHSTNARNSGPAAQVVNRILGTLGSGAVAGRVLLDSGIVRLYRPSRLARVGATLVRWGTGLPGGFAAQALLAGDRVAIVDEMGELTWGEVHRRSNALAASLRARGVAEGDAVAVMCRNHRGFIETAVALGKLGADALFLNTAFAGPQLVEVLAREAAVGLIYDEEFEGLLAAAPQTLRIHGWVEAEGATASTDRSLPTLETLIADGDEADLAAPDRHGRIVILTSGTTGTPKGAPRSEAGVDAAVALLSRLPLRHGWRTHIAAPLFHTWGFAHLALAMLLGSTMVLRRRFDPEEALRVLDELECQSFVVIPVMMQRILRLPEETLERYPCERLRVVAASGSALPGDLAVEWMDRFGDNLYNIYGSTEVAYAAIAQPDEMRLAPGTAGRAPHATVLRIIDPDGAEVPPGESGRIFVGNGMLFEGYSGGGNKEIVDGLMSTGDVGRFDESGLLFVEGRDDEMIVSGGENVFPKEVEDCLARHESVAEAAAIGVADDDFGQRLRAFVVRVHDEVGEDDLAEWIKQHLARYKVPREFVFLDELPRNATGKVLKRELHERD